MGTVIEMIGCNCVKIGKSEENSSKYLCKIENTAGTPPEKKVNLKIETRDFIRQLNEDVFKVYEKIKKLGEGAYGSVYSVRRKDTDIIRALKIIDKSKLYDGGDDDENNIKNEINILKQIDHPNIMKIFEFFEDNNSFYVIAEYCDSGDLHKIYENFGVFPEFLLKYVMYQVFLGISFLHNNHVVHSDVKEENIAFQNISNEKSDSDLNIFSKIMKNDKFLKEVENNISPEKLSPETNRILSKLCNLEVKIIDFGAAKFNKKNKKLTGIAGTDYYCSPEIIHEKYSFMCDEWACGVMMYILLSGNPPFPGDTEEEIFDNVLNTELNFDNLKNISPQCKDLISKLLIKDGEKRLKATEALKHEFFKTGVNIGNLLKGKQNENAELLETYINDKLKSNKKGNNLKFKDAVIAYIVFKFLDKNEENKIKKVFRQLSGEDKNYLITKDTFVNYMKSTSRELGETDINQIYSELDQNQSGTIEYEELMRGLCDKKKILSDKNLKDAFAFFDRDKNGKISLDEVTEIIFEGEAMPPNIKKDFIDEFGKDMSDTDIDYDDFLKIIKG